MLMIVGLFLVIAVLISAPTVLANERYIERWRRQFKHICRNLKLTTPGNSPEIKPWRFLDRSSQPFSGGCVSTHSCQRVKRCKEPAFSYSWLEKSCTMFGWLKNNALRGIELILKNLNSNLTPIILFSLHGFIGSFIYPTKVWAASTLPTTAHQNQLQRWEVTDPRAAKSAGGRDWLRRKRMHNAGVWASPGLRFYRKQRAWLANQKD